MTSTSITLTYGDGWTQVVEVSATAGAKHPTQTSFSPHPVNVGNQSQGKLVLTPQAPVAPVVVPPVGTLLFDGTRLASWALNQSAVTTGPNARVKEVPDPLGGSDTALEFTTLNGDVAPATPTVNPRSQLVSPDVVTLGGTYWESHEILIPVGSPIANATGWVALETPAYGAPFNGGGPVGTSVDYIASYPGVSDGVYFDWGDDAIQPRPYQWTMPVANMIGKWTRVTWHYTISVTGTTELYIDGSLVASVPVGGINAADKAGPWSGRLMLYYALNEFPQATVYHKNYKIGTTREIVEQ